MWFYSFLGRDCLRFEIHDLVAESSLPQQVAQSVLDFFSLNFGDVPRDFVLFSATHQLRERPLIHHEGSYMYPEPGAILWALKARIETALNSPETGGGGKTWTKYDRHRAAYLESETLRLIGDALRTKEIYRSLKYPFQEEGLSKQPELDGMIMYDSTLYLIVAKAGGFSSPARRGARERLRKDITDLIGKAHNQALRAKSYIDSTDDPEFVDKRGKKVLLDKARFSRTLIVTTTLEPMDVLNSVLHELVAAQLLKEENLPWAVSLGNLRVVCETIEFPGQLILYPEVV